MAGGIVGALLLMAAIVVCWLVVGLGPAWGTQATAAIARSGIATGPAWYETMFTLTIYCPLLIVGVGAAALERHNALAPGRRPAAMLPLGLLLGAGGVTVSMLYARFGGTMIDGTAGHAGATLLVWGVAIVGVQTLSEEVFFRGWLQPALVRRWGALPAVLATAVAFGMLHLAGGARAPVALVNLVLGGLMFGLLALRTGGIAAATGTHVAWNALEQLLYGLDPNPGIGSFGSVIDKDLIGPALLGGSEDGLNGSLGMTAALMAIVVPLTILGWRGLVGRDPARNAALSPATARVRRRSGRAPS